MRRRNQITERNGRMRTQMHTALTVAGSDSSGGAGIQADIKTMTMNGVYAMSAITALTAQNTTGVFGVQEVSPDFLGQQLDAVFSDIRPEAVKIGMMPSAELIRVTRDRLMKYGASHVVLDPVMISTSGTKLLRDDAAEALKRELFPQAELVTPNIPEAEALSGMSIRTEEDMIRAAKEISRTCGCAVLCKGGHRKDGDSTADLLTDGVDFCRFEGKRIDNPNTHGTGCTLSSAIAANLAKGFTLQESVKRAKEYITEAIGAMLDLGKGSGPMNHAFALPERWKEAK